MTRCFFLNTERIGFSKWSRDDINFAELLWGNPEVTKYICASGKFDKNEILNRLNREINNGIEYQVQYWPIFECKSNELIGWFVSSNRWQLSLCFFSMIIDLFFCTPNKPYRALFNSINKKLS